MISRIAKYLSANVEAAPLAVFRIFFGSMMFISILRFWANGWIEKLYLEPDFHFSYFGFEWIGPIGAYTYVLFVICGLAALCVAIGYRYRLAIVLFFLSFTYIELMDKTTYLNHYYFISLLSFLMIFQPAQAYYSIDANKQQGLKVQYIQRWHILSIQVLLAIVYVYAGLAKLNSDWLVEGMPLKIWLPSKFDIPILGSLLAKEWVIYAFSWMGAAYDLTIPFLLWNRKTRSIAFILVVVFHILTRVLFPIGMFPYIMIVSALIFFDPRVHKRMLKVLSDLLKIKWKPTDNGKVYKESALPIKRVILIVFFGLQFLLPWRYLFYPGELFWTEEGYRFSWRVMLMEKAGYAQFKIVSKTTGKWFYVDNTDFLTPFQEKQMSFQPDFILEYAHYLKSHFESQGHANLAVFVESAVSLNGRPSRPFIDPNVDLTLKNESFKHKDWILPFEDEIRGL